MLYSGMMKLLISRGLMPSQVRTRSWKFRVPGNTEDVMTNDGFATCALCMESHSLTAFQINDAGLLIMREALEVHVAKHPAFNPKKCI